jgi:hypothetical protein
MELRGVGWTSPVTEKKRGVGGLEEMMGQRTGETRDWRGRCGEAFTGVPLGTGGEGWRQSGGGSGLEFIGDTSLLTLLRLAAVLLPLLFISPPFQQLLYMSEFRPRTRSIVI